MILSIDFHIFKRYTKHDKRIKMIFKYCVLVGFSFIWVNNSNGQLLLTKDTVESIISSNPAFTIYKDNYFITGSTLSDVPDKYNSDAKYQISFKQRLVNQPLPFGFYPFLSYTQKTFWDIYVNSSPFAESNYNPSIFIIRPFFKKNLLHSSLILSIEHESNGRDRADGSKSWNFFSATYCKIITSKAMVSLKLWIPVGLSDNPDLMEYIGQGEATCYWVIKENRLTADMIARKGTSWDWKGSFQINIAFRPFRIRNQYLMLQWCYGYAESLIDYQQKHNILRVGLVLKPTFYRFY